MKDHFIKLFQYDKYANTTLLGLMQKHATDDGQSVKTMAHLLAAQQVWLSRCSGEPENLPAIWPDWSVNILADVIEKNSKEWIAYLNLLKPEDFDRMITYYTTRGEKFENKLIDILTHAINHGTHHRAQIGQLLKQTGQDLPFTDYILYVRTIA